MQKIAIADAVRHMEQEAVLCGDTLQNLMKKAGTRTAEYVLQHMPKAAQKVLVLCGKGNNGGDGYIAAQYLAEHGCTVTVLQTDGLPATELAQNAYAVVRSNSAIRFVSAEECGTDYTMVIDAVYGIGFRGALPPKTAELFAKINQWPVMRVAVDLPSGTECDTCRADPNTFRAAVTLSFMCLKPLHVHAPSDEYCGCVDVIDLDIPQSIIQNVPTYAELLTAADVAQMLPARHEESNKGSYGRALCVCGSYGMAGAAALAVSGALRSGCGLVQAALPEPIYPILAANLWEPIYCILPHENGQLCAASKKEILQAAAQANAVLFGCGIGRSDTLPELAAALIKEVHVPLIIDADGINALCTHIDVLHERTAPILFTPHPGEMARLCRCGIAEVQANRVQIAVQFARQFQAVLVLKGHHTVIAAPDGRVYICPTGNHGMAKGGSGDVLAGMITALAAQGMGLFEAACASVYVHGIAGDLCAAKMSPRAMQPTDLIAALSDAFMQIEAEGAEI